VVPIGFVSDHLEVVYDLDTEALPAARARGLRVERAATPGADPRIVAMVADLVAERTSGLPRAALGDLGASHDSCPLDCCPAPLRRGRAVR
ncbi:MAG: ferrochelatase, partial [Mycobacteriales bacterium]